MSGSAALIWTSRTAGGILRGAVIGAPPRNGRAPSPRWGEGWGEGVPGLSIGRNPSPGSLRDPTSPYGRGEVECADGRERSRLVLPAAGGRPFLDAREVVVVAVTGLPHRVHQRPIWFCFVLEL